MNQELVARVQNLMSRIDTLKVSKIETETKLKTLNESIEENLAKAKELGYNSLEELAEAQVKLEEVIKKECDSLEEELKKAGV